MYRIWVGSGHDLDASHLKGSLVIRLHVQTKRKQAGTAPILARAPLFSAEGLIKLYSSALSCCTRESSKVLFMPGRRKTVLHDAVQNSTLDT